jgi:hypothetical protein
MDVIQETKGKWNKGNGIAVHIPKVAENKVVWG